MLECRGAGVQGCWGTGMLVEGTSKAMGLASQKQDQSGTETSLNPEAKKHLSPKRRSYLHPEMRRAGQ